MPTTFDDGGRVYLRPIEKADVSEEYVSWFQDTVVTAFLESKNLNQEAILQYIETGKRTGSYHMYAVCFKENDKHIGNLKLGPINQRHKTSDLVTVIGDTAYWGKGLATEAVRIGNRIAFDELDLRKLSGGIYADNLGAVKSYTKAGWVVEGRLAGQVTLDGKVLDEILISCFNPKYFDMVDGKAVPK